MKLINFVLWLILLLFIITNLKMCNKEDWKQIIQEEITEITEISENSTFFD